MCGIAGVWGGRGARRLVSAMTPELVHRGPDAHGIWSDSDAELAFGHRRLSIIDLSAYGNQPMVSSDTKSALTYNGEVYNFAAIRDELGIEDLASTSDSEVILRAAMEIGVDALVRRCNGMFAFAYWDGRARELWLARDRAGIKPLYYGEVDGRFVFASELRALAAIHEGPEVNGASLALYVRYGYLPGQDSMLRGIKRLAPGHWLRVRRRDGKFEQRQVPYWSVFDVQPRAHRSAADAEEELDALLTDAVGARLLADVEVGAFLSGGIDSSVVLSAMSKVSTSKVKSFSIGFHDKVFDEAIYAKKVAESLGTDHFEHYLSGDEALSVIPELGQIYSEPFADPSQIPTTIVSRLARRHVKVALSGDGGDELFAGYRQYAFLHRASRMSRPVPAFIRARVGRTMQRGARRLRELGGPAGARRQLRRAEVLGGFIEGSAHSIGALYESFLDHWRGADVVQGYPNVPFDAVGRRADGKPERLQMMIRDLLTYLPDDILTKVDRASMSCSLEARVPLLDHRLIEFAFALPYELKVRGDATKWLLRQVLYRRVDRSLIERPKMGFSIPLGGWLRGPLRDWGESLLDERRLREEGYFDATVVRRCWDEHQRAELDWNTQLWDVLMFQAWMDTLSPGVMKTPVRDLRRYS